MKMRKTGLATLVIGLIAFSGLALAHTPEARNIATTDTENQTHSMGNVLQVPSTVPFGTSPEFTVNVTLDDTADTAAATANDNTNITLEATDEDADIVKVVNSTGHEFTPVEEGDFDGDGYPDAYFGDGALVQKVPAGSTADIELHFDLPAVQVSENIISQDVGRHTKYANKYIIHGAEQQDYSGAEIVIAPHDFDQRVGAVSVRLEGSPTLPDAINETHLTLKDRTVKAGSDTTVKVSYEVETAERAAPRRRVPAVARAKAPPFLAGLFKALAAIPGMITVAFGLA